MHPETQGFLPLIEEHFFTLGREWRILIQNQSLFAPRRAQSQNIDRITGDQIDVSTFKFLNPTEGGQPMWLDIWGLAIALAVGLSAVAIAMQR
jgi:hypothetical protein